MSRVTIDRMRVGVIGRYAKSCYPEKTLEKLQRFLDRAQSGDLSPEPKSQTLIHDITRRLSTEAIQQLVADYQSGQTTTQLLTTYDLSKSSVLKLLKDNGAVMRRQPPTEDQLRKAMALYESGKSLAAIEAQLDAPRESILRALVGAGVQMRARGGSIPKS